MRALLQIAVHSIGDFLAYLANFVQAWRRYFMKFYEASGALLVNVVRNLTMEVNIEIGLEEQAVRC